MNFHLLAWPPLVKGEPLMFLPQTSLDTDPNMAKVPRLWLTTLSASLELALNLCCALASSNSEETSSKASFRSLQNMGKLRIWAFQHKISSLLRRKRPRKAEIYPETKSAISHMDILPKEPVREKSDNSADTT